MANKAKKADLYKNMFQASPGALKLDVTASKKVPQCIVEKNIGAVDTAYVVRTGDDDCTAEWYLGEKVTKSDCVDDAREQ